MASRDFRTGIFLSSEECSPTDLVRLGRTALDLGFDDLSVSDHFHPWGDSQGHSPFVWSVLGALSAMSGSIRLGTGVTCPTTRIHPAILAQAAATTSLLTGGRFWLGVGTGEALNEQVLGDPWPRAAIRLEMLEEAVDIIRQLWTGDLISHDGEYYVVENARLYDAPDSPPPIMVSAYGPKAAALAAKIGDGMVTTGPDEETITKFRAHGGTGPVIALTKMCWDPDEDTARKTYHRLWPSSGVPSGLKQELRTPALFEEAAQIVTEDDAVGDTPCGPDPEPYAEALRKLLEAGVDSVYVQQVGSNHEQAWMFLRDEVLPRV